MTESELATWTRCRTAYNLVTLFAPMRKSALLRRLSLNWGSIEAVLMSMDHHGFLLYEDDKARLWPYCNRAAHYLVHHATR